MCILIVLRGLHRDHPIVVAANRDERTDRKASPPGLFTGRCHRMLSPRDRQAGGTWLAVDDRGWFAGLTNVTAVPRVPDAPSRGHLPHLALDEPDLDAAVAAVARRVREHPHAGFQLVLCDGERTLVLRNDTTGLHTIAWRDAVLVVTNEHGPGAFAPRGLPAALAPVADAARRLDALLPLLADRGGDGHHPICKRGDHYGTVSSSLIAVRQDAPTALVWRYAAGPPDVTPYRDYGNLGSRLLPECGP